MKISDYVESQIKGLWGTDFDENGIPVIKTNNLTYEGHIDYSDICKRNITREHAKECYLKPGDLLIEKSGGTKTHSVGYVSYFEGDENKFVCNNFILALRLKNTINSKFLFYQIQFKYESNQFSDCFNKTTGIQNLKVKDYLAKEIKIYSPEQQEKIVKELDTVRLIINKNKQILEKYDILIKSRFIEMTENSETELIRMGDIASYINGYAFKPEDWSNTGKKIIRIQNLNDKKAIYNHFEGNLDKKFLVRKNDVLISWATHLEAYIWDEEDAWLNQHIFKVVFDKRQVNKIYFVYSTEDALKIAFRNAHGFKPTMEHIKRADFENAEVKLPSLAVQEQFATFVQQIDKSKFAVQKSLEKAETLYKSLMQEFFG